MSSFKKLRIKKQQQQLQQQKNQQQHDTINNNYDNNFKSFNEIITKQMPIFNLNHQRNNLYNLNIPSIETNIDTSNDKHNQNDIENSLSDNEYMNEGKNMKRTKLNKFKK